MKTIASSAASRPGPLSSTTLLIDEYQSRVRDGSYPGFIINSIDLTKMLGLVGAGEFDELIAYLAFEVSRLAKAGAEVAAFASNTPHLVFEEVRQRSPIPLISIVEATRHELEERGPRRLGLVGTPFTMQGSFYPRVCRTRPRSDPPA